MLTNLVTINKEIFNIKKYLDYIQTYKHSCEILKKCTINFFKKKIYLICKISHVKSKVKMKNIKILKYKLSIVFYK